MKSGSAHHPSGVQTGGGRQRQNRPPAEAIRTTLVRTARTAVRTNGTKMHRSWHPPRSADRSDNWPAASVTRPRRQTGDRAGRCDRAEISALPCARGSAKRRDPTERRTLTSKTRLAMHKTDRSQTTARCRRSERRAKDKEVRRTGTVKRAENSDKLIPSGTKARGGSQSPVDCRAPSSRAAPSSRIEGRYSPIDGFVHGLFGSAPRFAKLELRLEIEPRLAGYGKRSRPSHQGRLEQNRRRHRAEQSQRHQFAHARGSWIAGQPQAAERSGLGHGAENHGSCQGRLHERCFSAAPGHDVIDFKGDADAEQQRQREDVGKVQR